MANTTSIILELQHMASDNKVGITDLLQKALLVASKLGLEDFKRWILNELEGYPDKESVPDYRIVSSLIKAYNPYRGWIHCQFEDQEMSKNLSNINFARPIGELEVLAFSGKDKNGMLEVTFTHETINLLMEMSNSDLTPTRFINKAKIFGILDTVRTKVLKWALTLEETDTQSRDDGGMNTTTQEPDNNSISSTVVEMTRYERFIKWCKNNRLICFILIVIIIVIGLGHLTDAYNKIRDSWFKPNSSTSQDVPVEISEISAFDEDRRTQLRPRIKKRVNELYDEINNEKLKPWVSFHIIPFQVTRHDGSVMSLGGVKFEGAPRNAFWMDGFIPPILENAIVKAFDQTTEECRANGIDPEPHLFETNLILGDLIIRIYNRMADIDKRLRGKGFPENVQAKDVQDEINKMNENLKRYYKAAVFLASEN